MGEWGVQAAAAQACVRSEFSHRTAVAVSPAEILFLVLNGEREQGDNTFRRSAGQSRRAVCVCVCVCMAGEKYTIE